MPALLRSHGRANGWTWGCQAARSAPGHRVTRSLPTWQTSLLDDSCQPPQREQGLGAGATHTRRGAPSHQGSDPTLQTPTVVGTKPWMCAKWVTQPSNIPGPDGLSSGPQSPSQSLPSVQRVGVDSAHPLGLWRPSILSHVTVPALPAPPFNPDLR